MAFVDETCEFDLTLGDEHDDDEDDDDEEDEGAVINPLIISVFLILLLLLLLLLFTNRLSLFDDEDLELDDIDVRPLPALKPDDDDDVIRDAMALCDESFFIPCGGGGLAGVC